MAKEHVAEVADCAGVVLLCDKLVPQKVSNLFTVAMALGLGLHHGSSLDVRFEIGISRREERTCLKNRSRMLSRSPGAGI